MSNVATQNLGRVCVVPKGYYDSTVAYKKLDIVYNNGFAYVAKQDSIGEIPSNDANNKYWMVLTGSSLGHVEVVNNVLKWIEGDN